MNFLTSFISGVYVDFAGSYFVVLASQLERVCVALHDFHQCTGFVAGKILLVNLGSPLGI